MASIYREISINRDAESAWAALRQFDAAAQLFAGVLVDCHCTGDVREVTFAGGRKLIEELVTQCLVMSTLRVSGRKIIPITRLPAAITIGYQSPE
jgi:hypothetical protein